jgi:hypothetical protein
MMIYLLSLVSSTVIAREGLQWAEQRHDFGQVGIDFTLFNDFKLYNNGTTPIRLDSIVVDCDCSQISLRDSIISPGDTVVATVSFNTRDYFGPVTKSMWVYSNDKSVPMVELYYSAIAGQFLTGTKPDPTSLLFLPGQTKKNVSFSNLIFDSMEIFSLDPYDDAFNVETVRASASKGESLTLQVTTSSNLSRGTYLTCLRIGIMIDGDANKRLYVSIPIRVVVKK